MNSEPEWLGIARRHIGQTELPGPPSSAWIRNMWHRLKGGAWYWTHYGSDDSRLPWCGALVALCLDEAGLPYPQNYASARAYLDYGVRLNAPILGCIVVYERAGGGHVGFVVGRDDLGFLMTLGGNQGDKVSIAPFNTNRVLGYRWPPGAPYTSAPLARYVGNHTLSNNEA